MQNTKVALIRPGQIKDIPEINSILNQFPYIPSFYRYFLFVYIALNKCKVYDDGQVKGFVCYRGRRLYVIGVRKADQHKGIGKQLLKTFENETTHKEGDLIINRAHKKAFKFYMGQGYSFKDVADMIKNNNK